MLKYLPYIIVIILTALLMFFLMKGCNEPEPIDNSNELNELKAERESLTIKNQALLNKVDSLEAIKQRTKMQIIYRTAEIDSSIAKDSSNSLVEYRRSLQDNDYLPDGTLYLSYREVGLGAILMARLPKMQLQINLCEEQSGIKDKIIEDHKFIEKSYEQSLGIHKKNTEYYKELYEESNEWYHEDWIWLTLGVILTGGVVAVIGAVN